MTTYAINVMTGASTRYDNFGFDSFCRAEDGKYYGIRADGIYRLEGADDAGVPIDADIDFGHLDFGTSAEKRIATAYAGVASDEVMELRIQVGDETYDYPARSSSETLQQQRFDVGKGLKSNYFDVSIHNTDGGDFEMDSIEIAAVSTSRRIQS
jgi:hypothetical protein